MCFTCKTLAFMFLFDCLGLYIKGSLLLLVSMANFCQGIMKDKQIY